MACVYTMGYGHSEPNARHEPLPEAGARGEWTLEAVGFMP
jgi:hypothetical protein